MIWVSCLIPVVFELTFQVECQLLNKCSLQRMKMSTDSNVPHPDAQATGSMLAFLRNRLDGSYFFFSATSLG